MTLQEFLRAEGREPPASHRRHSRRVSQLGIGKSKVRRVNNAHLHPPGSSHQRAASGGAAISVRRVDPAHTCAAYRGEPMAVGDDDEDEAERIETRSCTTGADQPSFDEADPARSSLSLLPPLPLSPLADGFFSGGNSLKTSSSPMARGQGVAEAAVDDLWRRGPGEAGFGHRGRG